MTIKELINYFRYNGNEVEFYEKNNLDIESEVIEIYMQKPFDLKNEIRLFEIEKTEGNLKYEFENCEYYNLTDFYHFFDFIEDIKFKKNEKISNEKLAEIFMKYCINDA